MLIQQMSRYDLANRLREMADAIERNVLIHWATLEMSAMSAGEFASGECPGAEGQMQGPTAPESVVEQTITIRLMREG
ncbi:hypothetical protein ACTJNK_29655 [Achromobacter anxifer]|jgi:hypothetical protein|uniref:hypothetical protein n=1 Tax=Achromobacter aegrifaciens TaxID=1287736 RepID=UPI000750C221|nr:hypothetical protein [Achromobacter aegrifaciens]WLW63667.1 hypothetical protein RA224_09650 [Achromobacter aegrifaciens]